MAIRTGIEGKPAYYGLLVGLVAGGALFFLGYKTQIEPLKGEIATQEARLKELQIKISEGRAAEQQLAQFREQVRSLELELDKLLRILPARRNTPEILRRIRTLVEQGNFGFRWITPRALIDKDFYSEWPIIINLSGNYHNLALFFDRIGRFSRIVNIENLTIVAERAQRSNQTIAATFTAKTFIYKEPPAEPAAGPGGPKKGPRKK